MAQATISGTFSGTGQSAQWTGGKVVLLDFAGTASVNLEIRLESTGAWIIYSTKTADAVIEDFPTNATYRLNCTAHTDNVTYEVRF